MAGDKTTSSSTKTQPAKGSWARTNSRQMLKNYDKSPLASPTHSPSASRNNSVTSLNSTTSEPSGPLRPQPSRHLSAPHLYSSDDDRRKSDTAQPSTKSTASHKSGGFKSFFRHKTPEEKERERQRNEELMKETQRLIVRSRHEAAVKAKMMSDPAYREHLEKHNKPKVKTAGVEGSNFVHSLAAQQEMRYPHSGPPTLHGALDLPKLSKIESHDDDDELDDWQRTRKEWNEAKEHNLMDEIPEIRSRVASRHASPFGSPVASREPSPNRLGPNVVRPALGSKRNSWAGATAVYHKDPQSGRWRKTPPGTTPSMTSVLPQPGDMHPDLLAKSLAERLNTSA